MDYHGLRYLTTSQFTSRLRDLNIESVTDRELEFYEQHCLLLPVARTIESPEHAVARYQVSFGVSDDTPGSVESPEEWRRLADFRFVGVRSFDDEFGKNPYLVKPDCSTFEPWDSRKVEVRMATGDVIQCPTVERYYSYWQVHVLHLLQKHGYYRHAWLLRQIPEEVRERTGYDVPVDTEWARTFHGMATGYDALTRYQSGYLTVLTAVRESDDSRELSEAERVEVQARLGESARAAVAASGLDEESWFKFVWQLVELKDRYRRDEHLKLSAEVERDIWLALEVSGYAFALDWSANLEAMKRHVGEYAMRLLREIDPVEAAAEVARRNLGHLFGGDPGIPLVAGEAVGMPGRLVEFCMNHELFEVLSALGGYSFSDDDLKRDKYPGFSSRRLRPLALAVEQLLRGIFDVALRPHVGWTLDPVLREFARGESWEAEFKKQLKNNTSDNRKTNQPLIEQSILRLFRSITPTDSESLKIARVLVIAVAARNLVSHRHRFVSNEVARIATGECARAIVVIWVLAARRGWV